MSASASPLAAARTVACFRLPTAGASSAGGAGSARRLSRPSRRIRAQSAKISRMAPQLFTGLLS
jgi:hypothetical protein